jgi:hypothetical protein
MTTYTRKNWSWTLLRNKIISQGREEIWLRCIKVTGCKNKLSIIRAIRVASVTIPVSFLNFSVAIWSFSGIITSLFWSHAVKSLPHSCINSCCFHQVAMCSWHEHLLASQTVSTCCVHEKYWNVLKCVGIAIDHPALLSEPHSSKTWLHFLVRSRAKGEFSIVRHQGWRSHRGSGRFGLCCFNFCYSGEVSLF